MNQNVIETEDLTKNYGGQDRVKKLSLHVPQECVYGFLGPNGAGKSTTLKMILGLAHPTAGQVTVLGEKMNDKNRLRVLRQVGSLIESPSYYGHLTGEENMEIAASLRGLGQTEINEALGAVRLNDAKKRLVRHYSLGMKQRLGLAMALLGRPKLLILDEPTNGLDPAGIQEMRQLIVTLPEEYGMTVVVSSHLLSEIDQMATVVGIIREGQLVFEGTLEALHAHSRHGLALRTLDNAQAVRILTAAGMSYNAQGENLMLPLMDDTKAGQLVMKLAQNGATPVRLTENDSSLEDIFLTLTGKAASL